MVLVLSKVQLRSQKGVQRNAKIKHQPLPIGLIVPFAKSSTHLMLPPKHKSRLIIRRKDLKSWKKRRILKETQTLISPSPGESKILMKTLKILRLLLLKSGNSNVNQPATNANVNSACLEPGTQAAVLAESTDKKVSRTDSTDCTFLAACELSSDKRPENE